MKNKISRLIAGICLIAMFGMAGYVGGLATHSVFAPSETLAAEEETPCENNVCIKNWLGKKKCKVAVGDHGSGCRLLEGGGCEGYRCSGSGG